METPRTEATHIYHCGRKRCRLYHKEVEGIGPRESREATGFSPRCAVCGEVLWLLRRKSPAEQVKQ